MIFLDAAHVPANGALARRLRGEGLTPGALAEVVAQGYLLEIPPATDLGHEVAGVLELRGEERPAVRCRLHADP